MSEELSRWLASVVRLTLLCINSEAVIPAKAGIQRPFCKNEKIKIKKLDARLRTSGMTEQKECISGQARNDNQSKGTYGPNA